MVINMKKYTVIIVISIGIILGFFTGLYLYKIKQVDRQNDTEKIAKLINVKSLVTLILTLVVAYKAIMGQMDIEQIYLMIIAFYFGTQLKESKTE